MKARKRRYSPRNRPKETIALENLPDRSAPDKPEETVPTTVRVSLEDKEWLDGQEESNSFHVRQALAGYRADFAKLQAIAARLGILPGEVLARCVREFPEGEP